MVEGEANRDCYQLFSLCFRFGVHLHNTVALLQYNSVKNISIHLKLRSLIFKGGKKNSHAFAGPRKKYSTILIQKKGLLNEVANKKQYEMF